MKTGLACLVIASVAAAPLAAQNPKPIVTEYFDLNVDTLTARYRLDEQQKTKTIALLKTWSDATAPTLSWMSAQRRAHKPANADSAKKINDATAKFNADFRAVLTTDQARRFDALHKARGPGSPEPL